MKKVIVALTLGVSIAGLSACSIGGNTIVKTESGSITKDDFYKELSSSNTGAQVLENMIEKKVLEENYKVPDKDVEAKLKEVKSQFSSNDDFKSALESNGLKNEDALKEQIKLSLLQVKAVTDGVKASDAQLKKYFEENKDQFLTIKASHILVADEATAKKIKAELDKGADFAKLAKENSTDTATASNGGDLGEFTKSDMLQEFSNAAFALKVNEISNPVKTDYGYHIIKVTKRTQKTLEKNKDEIKEAYKLAHANAYADVIKKLKKKSDVSIKDEDLKDAVDNLLSSSSTASASSTGSAATGTSSSTTSGSTSNSTSTSTSSK